MENFEHRELGEEEIDFRIENLAQKEGMDAENIFSDITTFIEMYEEDKNVIGYFEELASQIGISVDEMIECAIKKQGNAGT